MSEKVYVEINAFIADLKSSERYERNCDPLYDAIVNETEKNLRAWAASEEAPEVVPVVHGYWDDPSVNDKKISYCSPVKCSICGTINATTAYTYNFCGHCGAKMDEETPET